LTEKVEAQRGRNPASLLNSLIECYRGDVAPNIIDLLFSKISFWPHHMSAPRRIDAAGALMEWCSSLPRFGLYASEIVKSSVIHFQMVHPLFRNRLRELLLAHLQLNYLFAEVDKGVLFKKPKSGPLPQHGGMIKNMAAIYLTNVALPPH
jgi:hypothetical protein